MDEVLNDQRFAHIAKDPRYRRIPREERKVKIDKRFQTMFSDKRFKLKYSVDKRGKPVNLTSNENLKKYYALSDEDNSSSSEDEGDSDEEEDSDEKEESGEEEDSDEEEESDSDDGLEEESDAGTDGSDIQDDRLAAVKDDADQGDDSDNRISTEQHKNKKKSKDVAKKIKQKTKTAKLKKVCEVNRVKPDGESEEDSDIGETLPKPKGKKKQQKEKLKKKKQNKKDEKKDDSDSAESLTEKADSGIDFARGWGNVASSSSEEEDDEDSEEEDKKGQEQIDHKWGEMDQNVERVEEATRRVAMCNMDWDRVSAKDIFILLHSFKPTNGVIHSVKVYPSKFGKQRMKEEEAYGPKELRETKLDNDEEKVEDKEGTKYHIEKLRQYQLNRLRYYYAVVELDTKDTANSIYEECDGMEYETSSTKLDLRFIPDDMEFDDDAKSECTELPVEYKPSLFTNSALSQSKVDLTWDETDRMRQQVTSKQFTSKDKTADDADLQAYLASSSDEEGVDYGGLVEASDKESNGSDDEEKQIEKYKKLLQDIDKKDVKKKKKDVQMEITWEPGLREATEGMIKKKKTKELTPWQEYLQKKEEKKMKKREERKKKSQAGGKERDSSEENVADQGEEGLADGETAFSDDELPADFDQSDPFFDRSDPFSLRDEETEGRTKTRKDKKKKKKAAGTITEEDDAEKAELSLLVMDEDADSKKHFSLNKLIEESSGKKKKKNKKLEKQKKEKNEEEFQVQLDDPRFSAVYSSHLYNIDPSAPEYRKTKGSEAIIKEKLNRSSVNAKKHKLSNTGDNIKHKKRKSDDRSVEERTLSKPVENRTVNESLSSLVKSVKAKTQQFHNKTKR